MVNALCTCLWESQTKNSFKMVKNTKKIRYHESFIYKLSQSRLSVSKNNRKVKYIYIIKFSCFYIIIFLHLLIIIFCQKGFFSDLTHLEYWWKTFLNSTEISTYFYFSFFQSPMWHTHDARVILVRIKSNTTNYYMMVIMC